MAKVVRTSFNGGELSQLLTGRDDLEKYYSGLSTSINAIPLPSGGIRKRPGFEYVSWSPSKARLIDFVFSANDTLILELTDSLIRYINSDGIRVTEDTDYEFTTSESDNYLHIDGVQESLNGKFARFADCLTDELNTCFTLNYAGSAIKSYATELEFTEGDRVSSNLGLSTCAVSHTAISTFEEEDFIEAYQAIRGRVDGIPSLVIALYDTYVDREYSGTTEYVLGDVVKYNYEYYGCIATTTGNLPTDETYWVSVNEWESGSKYAVNNFVFNKGDAYRCTVAINNSSTRPKLDTTHWAKCNFVKELNSQAEEFSEISAWVAGTYGAGSYVVHEGFVWTNASSTSGEPGVTGWTKYAFDDSLCYDAEEWDSGVDFPLGDFVVYNNIIYRYLDNETAWVSGTSYTVGDYVLYSSKMYECISDVSGTTVPSSDADHWTDVGYTVNPDDYPAAWDDDFYNSTVQYAPIFWPSQTLFTSGIDDYEVSLTDWTGSTFGSFSMLGLTDDVSGLVSGTINLVYETDTDYTEAELFDIQYRQIGDYIYLFHESHPVQKLVRNNATTNNDWSIADAPFDAGPFLERNTDTNIQMWLNARKYGVLTAPDTGFWEVDEDYGTIYLNVTEGEDVFNENQVGALFQIDNVIENKEYSGTSTTDDFYNADSVLPTVTGRRLYGEFTLSIDTDNYCTLWRKVGVDGIWEKHRFFSEDTDYVATETTEGVFYALSPDSVGSNITSYTLEIEPQELSGIVRITAYDSDYPYRVEVEIVKPVYYEAKDAITLPVPVNVTNWYTTSVESTDRYNSPYAIINGTVHLCVDNIKELSANMYENGDSVAITNESFSELDGSTFYLKNVSYTYGNEFSGIYRVYFYAIYEDEDLEIPLSTLTKETSRVTGFIALSNQSSTTHRWSEGAFSDYRGYPSAGAFYSDRLFVGGTTYKPTGLWGSVIGAYDNFTVGSGSTDAISIEIITDDASKITWLASRDTLIAGTLTAEYMISAHYIEEAITPTDIVARLQSSNGSKKLSPKMIKDSLIYIGRDGTRLNEMTYNDTQRQLVSNDINRLATEVLDNGVVDFTAQVLPYNILWLVTKNGVLASLTYNKDEQVYAWSRHITGDYDNDVINGTSKPSSKFLSATTIRSGQSDAVWCSIKRKRGSLHGYFIERMCDWEVMHEVDNRAIDSYTTNASDYVFDNISSYSTEYVLGATTKVYTSLYVPSNDFSQNDIVYIPFLSGYYYAVPFDINGGVVADKSEYIAISATEYADVTDLLYYENGVTGYMLSGYDTVNYDTISVPRNKVRFHDNVYFKIVDVGYSTLSVADFVSTHITGTLENFSSFTSPTGKVTQFFSGSFYGTLTEIEPNTIYRLTPRSVYYDFPVTLDTGLDIEFYSDLLGSTELTGNAEYDIYCLPHLRSDNVSGYTNINNVYVSGTSQSTCLQDNLGNVHSDLPEALFAFGIPFTMEIATMPFSAPQSDFNGSFKFLPRMMMKYVNTQDIEVGVRYFNNLTDTSKEYKLSSPTLVRDSVARNVDVECTGGVNRDNEIVIKSDSAYPVNIISITIGFK